MSFPRHTLRRRRGTPIPPAMTTFTCPPWSASDGKGGERLVFSGNASVERFAGTLCRYSFPVRQQQQEVTGLLDIASRAAAASESCQTNLRPRSTNAYVRRPRPAARDPFHPSIAQCGDDEMPAPMDCQGPPGPSAFLVIDVLPHPGGRRPRPCRARPQLGDVERGGQVLGRPRHRPGPHVRGCRSASIGGAEAGLPSTSRTSVEADPVRDGIRQREGDVAQMPASEQRAAQTGSRTSARLPPQRRTSRAVQDHVQGRRPRLPCRWIRRLGRFAHSPCARSPAQAWLSAS